MDTITNEILPEWRLKDQPFTSGIVNRSNPLPYHLDSGNLKGSMSAMVVMQQGVLG